MSRNYTMLFVLIPEDEHDQTRFSDGSMHVQLAGQIRGEPMECAAMLQNMAADVMTSIKNEIAKGGK